MFISLNKNIALLLFQFCVCILVYVIFITVHILTMETKYGQFCQNNINCTFNNSTYPYH